MIKHIVMWKLKEEVEGNTKKYNAEQMKIMLEGLQGKIEGLLNIEVGIDINKSSQAYDVVLYSEFKDEAALNFYQQHPLHKQAGLFVKNVASSRAVVDYRI